MDNTCVCCGAVIPEGRMICWACENRQGVSPERRANGTVVLQYLPHELAGHYFTEVT